MTELIAFLVAGMVLCFTFRMKIMLKSPVLGGGTEQAGPARPGVGEAQGVSQMSTRP